MEKTIHLERPEHAAELYGPRDRNLREIRDTIGVQVFARNGGITVTGDPDRVARAAAAIGALQKRIAAGEHLSAGIVAGVVSTVAAADNGRGAAVLDVYTAGRVITAKTPGQEQYLQAVSTCDLVFCTGPAGTGKTYLAVAVAVNMLKHHRARRLILARPAVEAGEKLGFLPGDMKAKVNPYLRPLFDALHDMMEYDQIRRFMADDLIEVIPLAFMRGRTLNDSVIILDEAQNTTPGQMLMFLTRMGWGSKVIVTGDISQTDLEAGAASGMVDAMNRLRGMEGLSLIRLEKSDIVRHKLVQNIVRAYERGEDG